MEEWEPEDSEVIKLKGKDYIHRFLGNEAHHVIYGCYADEETKERLESDAMFRLEHGVMDQQVEKESVPVLTQLQQLQNSSWSDPYSRSQQLRRKFREQKKKDKALEEEADRIRDKHSLHIPLLPETVDDVVRAKMIQYSGEKHGWEWRSKRMQITYIAYFRPISCWKAQTGKDSLHLIPNKKEKQKRSQ